jgi:hypothetical protein
MSSSNGARDAVIVAGLRTPFGKRGGVFSAWHPVEMLSFTLKGLIGRARVDAAGVEDVIGGCVGSTPGCPSPRRPRPWIANAAQGCRRFSSPRKASWLAATTSSSPAVSRI